MRRTNLNDPAGMATAMLAGAQRVAWALSGFGRVPADFEDWIGPIIDSATSG